MRQKYAGSDYWKHMQSCMDHLGFTPCLADPKVWMRKTINTKDNTKYWENVLLYVDDTLRILHKLHKVLIFLANIGF